MTNKGAVDPALAARSRKLRRGINLYPPYLGAGVRVTHIADDFRHIEVEMPLPPAPVPGNSLFSGTCRRESQ